MAEEYIQKCFTIYGQVYICKFHYLRGAAFRCPTHSGGKYKKPGQNRLCINLTKIVKLLTCYWVYTIEISLLPLFIMCKGISWDNKINLGIRYWLKSTYIMLELLIVWYEYYFLIRDKNTNYCLYIIFSISHIHKGIVNCFLYVPPPNQYGLCVGM